jgi:uncharacterized phiE125 gp8 family phage protein
VARRLVSPPDDQAEVISLASAKLHLRVDHSAEDALIQEYFAAAWGYAEGRTNRALLSQTWLHTADAFPAANEVIRLPLPPLQAVEWIRYVDPSGSLQTLDPAAYVVDETSEPARIACVGAWPATRPVPGAVRVQFVAGYEDPLVIPREIIQAVRMLAGHFYANREAVVTGTISTPLSLAADTLLDLNRHLEYS